MASGATFPLIVLGTGTPS